MDNCTRCARRSCIWQYPTAVDSAGRLNIAQFAAFRAISENSARLRLEM